MSLGEGASSLRLVSQAQAQAQPGPPRKNLQAFCAGTNEEKKKPKKEKPKKKQARASGGEIIIMGGVEGGIGFITGALFLGAGYRYGRLEGGGKVWAGFDSDIFVTEVGLYVSCYSYQSSWFRVSHGAELRLFLGEYPPSWFRDHYKFSLGSIGFPHVLVHGVDFWFQLSRYLRVGVSPLNFGINYLNYSGSLDIRVVF